MIFTTSAASAASIFPEAALPEAVLSGLETTLWSPNNKRGCELQSLHFLHCISPANGTITQREGKVIQETMTAAGHQNECSNPTRYSRASLWPPCQSLANSMNYTEIQVGCTQPGPAASGTKAQASELM